MALMHCPECDKKISDKASQCPHCEKVLVADPEKLETQRRINRIKKSSSLISQSFLGLMMFIGGLAYSSWYADEGMSTDKIASQVIAGIGVFWYLVTRIRILMFKRSARS